MKLTKNCLYPWSFMQIHGGGMMQPCAVGPDTDLGDFFIDYLDKLGDENPPDFLNNEGLRMLRKGMMTGNLRPMCQKCFFWSNELIPVEEFQKNLKNYLRGRLPENMDLDHADLSKVYAYNWMAISFTNRCNLSCVYCVQSTMKDSNPYFKAEIPYRYTHAILDMMASHGIDRISTCVEGEATLYRYWQEVFSWFHQKYPHIQMYMTTNLNREYSDADMELLASYTVLDVSIDSLNPKRYAKFRRNGRLELLLKNLNKLDAKIKDMKIHGPQIILHTVVSSESWREIESLADFALQRGYSMNLGNYEERINTVAYQEKMLKPLAEMPMQEVQEAKQTIQRVIEKFKQAGIEIILQGDIFKDTKNKAEKQYHRFTITGNHPIYRAFMEQIPDGGTKDLHFDIVYDRDNISYAGILFTRSGKLHLENLPDFLRIVYREVFVYKQGELSHKYHFPIEPGYRKTMEINGGVWDYIPIFKSDNIEAVLLDISEIKVSGKG